MNTKRQNLIKRLETLTDRDVYIMFTATNSKHYSINTDQVAVYSKVLCERKKRRKNALLILETSGGEPTTVITLVDMLKQCYEHVKGYTVFRAYSAGTIGLLVCDEIGVSSYGFLTPIDLQIYPDVSNDYKALIAYFNTYIKNTSASERELRFEEKYPEDYLSALTRNQYAQKTLKPLVEKHCKDKSKVDEVFEYLNGGAGLHNVKISRTKLINMGLKINKIPEEEEIILTKIIDTYISDTDMLVSSLLAINGIEEIKNAYFETLKSSYVHYEIYKSEIAGEVEGIEVIEEKSDEDTPEDDEEEMTMAVIAKSKICIECGWRQDID